MFAAHEEEARALVGRLPRSGTIGPRIACWEGDGMVVAVGGVGKVSAAMATQFVHDAFKPRCIVAVGLAGALKADASRGHVIVASAAVQHDVEARFRESAINADAAVAEKLTVAAKRAVENPRIVRPGLVLTGDQIVTSKAARDAIAKDFPDGACIDMETAAIAQVAQQNGLPWGAVRITSDSTQESFDLEAVIDFGVSSSGELFARIITDVLTDL